MDIASKLEESELIASTKVRLSNFSFKELSNSSIV